MTKDAMWVMPDGTSKVVQVDDAGNRVDDAPAPETVEPAEAEPADKPKSRKKR